MDSRALRVISRLDRQSIIERNGKARIAPGQEMLAITADTGGFFSILLKAIKGKRVLEIGRSAGFSRLWFADAVGKKGKIITIEEDPLKVERARDNFRQAGGGTWVGMKRGGSIGALQRVNGM